MAETTLVIETLASGTSTAFRLDEDWVGAFSEIVNELYPQAQSAVVTLNNTDYVFKINGEIPSDSNGQEYIQRLVKTNTSYTLTLNDPQSFTIRNATNNTVVVTNFGTIGLKIGDVLSITKSSKVYNKVVYGDTTLMDITDTTAEETDVAEGKTFYKKNGEKALGTATSQEDVFVANVNGTTYSELVQAIADNKVIVVDDGGLNYAPAVVNPYFAEPEFLNLTYYNDAHEQITYKVIDGIRQWVLSKTKLQPPISNPVAGDIVLTNGDGMLYDSGMNVNGLQDVFLITRGGTLASDIRQAIEDGKIVCIETSEMIMPVVAFKSGNEDAGVILYTNIDGVWQLEYCTIHNRIWTQVNVLNLQQATENELGLVKLNPSQSVTLDADGKLVVGGRLGQFPNGGVFYPTNIEPTNVGASSFLMSDGAKDLSLSARSFGIMAGANLTCKSANAGATQYRLSNTQSNRFACFAGKNGRLALSQADAQANGTALITSIKFANGNDISAYFGPTESSNDIIITVNRTVNPMSSTTSLRLYGTSTSSDVIIVGQGNGAIGGKAISLGQSCFAGGNQCIAFGNMSISTGNNSVAFGHSHLVNKQFCFAAGQGHDFTNGSSGAGAVGIASEISSDTAFAVGNGTFTANGITKSNALEVKKDGSIVMKSPNGTKYKISVDNNGIINTTQI